MESLVRSLLPCCNTAENCGRRLGRQVRPEGARLRILHQRPMPRRRFMGTTAIVTQPTRMAIHITFPAIATITAGRGGRLTGPLSISAITLTAVSAIPVLLLPLSLLLLRALL